MSLICCHKFYKRNSEWLFC